MVITIFIVEQYFLFLSRILMTYLEQSDNKVYCRFFPYSMPIRLRIEEVAMVIDVLSMCKLTIDHRKQRNEASRSNSNDLLLYITLI